MSINSPDTTKGTRMEDLNPRFTRGPSMISRGGRALNTYKGVLGLVVILIVYFALSQSNFASSANLTNVLETNAVLLIVSVGLTLPMLAGGFDLSVAGVVALSGVLLVTMLNAHWPLWLAIIVVVVGATLFGAFINGLLIGYAGLNFFIVTLGTLTVTQGVAYYVTQGNTLTTVNISVLAEIGTGVIGTVPIDAIIALVLLLLGIGCLRYTGLGRAIYAVGGNQEAARMAGINVPLTRLITYALASAFASIAGIIEVGRLASAGPTTDSTIELTAAAAVLIGGTAFGGGVGTMLGTFLGVAFLGILQNGLLISGISSYWQGIITGTELVASVFADRARVRSRRRSRLTFWRKRDSKPLKVIDD